MIGDVLTSSVLFEAIKLKHPSAELHYLVNSHTMLSNKLAIYFKG